MKDRKYESCQLFLARVLLVLRPALHTTVSRAHGWEAPAPPQFQSDMIVLYDLFRKRRRQTILHLPPLLPRHWDGAGTHPLA